MDFILFRFWYSFTCLFISRDSLQNYTNILTISLVDETGAELSDEMKTEKKDKMADYKARLDGGADFKTIYEEENGEQTTSTDTTEEKPEDELAQVLGSDDTEDYASDYYEDVRALQLGETKIIEDEANSQILLVVKGKW